jgi:hypothetical protein
LTTKILTDAELACLLEVKTTVKQARTILKRNQLILKALEVGEHASIRIGCPHCMATRTKELRVNCGTCAYSVAGPESGLGGTWCLGYSFGGFTGHDIIGVELCTDSVEVFGGDLSSLQREKAIIWTKGHIEWAREVIRRGERKKPAKDRHVQDGI